MSKPKNIIYSRGYPYGAPMIYLRGGGTRDPEVRALLKQHGFVYESRLYAWQGVNLEPEIPDMLLALREMGYVVRKKDTDEHRSIIPDIEP